MLIGLIPSRLSTGPYRLQLILGLKVTGLLIRNFTLFVIDDDALQS